MAKKKRPATQTEKQKAREEGKTVPTHVIVDTVTGTYTPCSSSYDSSSSYSSDSSYSSGSDSGSSGSCDGGGSF